MSMSEKFTSGPWQIEGSFRQGKRSGFIISHGVNSYPEDRAKLECSIFVDFDCNDEPYVSEIWVEPITGKGIFLVLPDSSGEREMYWKALSGPAWEAVKGDVADDLMEAA